MYRSDQAHARGEPVKHGSIGLDADARMEKQKGRAFSALDHLNADAANADCLYHRFAPPLTRRTPAILTHYSSKETLGVSDMGPGRDKCEAARPNQLEGSSASAPVSAGC